MFIGVLGIMAFVGFLITIKFQIDDIEDGNLTYFQLVINMLDLITITVPPALPTCLSIGISFALSRL
jgi:cation-transporting ATPase 13A3/4/5